MTKLLTGTCRLATPRSATALPSWATTWHRGSSPRAVSFLPHRLPRKLPRSSRYSQNPRHDARTKWRPFDAHPRIIRVCDAQKHQIEKVGLASIPAAKGQALGLFGCRLRLDHRWSRVQLVDLQLRPLVLSPLVEGVPPRSHKALGGACERGAPINTRACARCGRTDGVPYRPDPIHRGSSRAGRATHRRLAKNSSRTRLEAFAIMAGRLRNTRLTGIPKIVSCGHVSSSCVRSRSQRSQAGSYIIRSRCSEH